MENASKALLMAGGVLIALLILGALLLMFNNLSAYQKVGEEETRESQVIEFNNQFETYQRKNIRGSDMISLMNRVVDYNTRKVDNTQENFQKMEIEITGIDVKNLMYDEKKGQAMIQTSYTQDNIQNLLSQVQKLENKYQTQYITTLSSNINKVMDSQEEVEKLLPKSLNTYGGYDSIKEDTVKYYQYSQFKRVYFNCDTKETKYSNLGRIVKLKFICTNKLNERN